MVVRSSAGSGVVYWLLLLWLGGNTRNDGSECCADGNFCDVIIYCTNDCGTNCVSSIVGGLTSWSW